MAELVVRWRQPSRWGRRLAGSLDGSRTAAGGLLDAAAFLTLTAVQVTLTG
jgi:hypothetical protein